MLCLFANQIKILNRTKMQGKLPTKKVINTFLGLLFIWDSFYGNSSCICGQKRTSMTGQ